MIPGLCVSSGDESESRVSDPNSQLGRDQVPVVQSLEPTPPRKRRGWQTGAIAVSAAAHLGVLAAVLLARETPQYAHVDPAEVHLVTWTPPPPPTPPAKVPTPKPSPTVPKHEVHETPPPERSIARRPRAPSIDDLLRVAPAEKTGTIQSQGELTDADLAGASTAGSGSGGGGECNMARRIQNALRKDGLVQAAVAVASGSSKAIMVWNGDWVQTHSEDGKGLAAVREAIIWEIAFAPAACKAQAMHGLMLISLNDGSETARLAIGHGEWRWSDMLALRRGGG
jgi:hypothetical protein